jgi:hypothetical protein
MFVQRGSFTAEAAAGLYLEDRQSTVKCLMLLLQDVLQQDLSPQDPPRFVCVYVCLCVRSTLCFTCSVPILWYCV